MRLKYSIAIFITLLCFTFWILGLFLFIDSVSDISKNRFVKKLDAIVVLTGGSNRIDEGFNLLKRRLGKKLFISGVYRGVDAKQLLRRWKKESKTKLDCCVVLGFKAENTSENAEEAIKWLKKEKFKSFYLVTSNYHMKRAMLEFQTRSSEFKIIPFNIMPNKNNIDIKHWWKESKSRNLIFREYTKYIAVYALKNIIKR